MILLYATDLIFTTRIRAEATAAGATIHVARGVDSLRSRLEALSEGAAAAALLVIVDLDADAALDAVRVSAESQARPQVVAFVSHVRADLAAAARGAGADQVMARSEFVRRLPALVQEHSA
jgi:orotidine-5'-phosphate decarboxylase